MSERDLLAILITIDLAASNAQHRDEAAVRTARTRAKMILAVLDADTAFREARKKSAKVSSD